MKSFVLVSTLICTLLGVGCGSAAGVEGKESNEDKYILDLRNTKQGDNENILSMEIMSVAPRLIIDRYKDSFEDADAAIYLRFKNKIDEETQLPCWQPSGGKGSKLALVDVAPQVQLKVNKVPSDFGCDLATLQYNWSDVDGNIVKSGTKCLSSEYVKIPPKGEGLIVAPIKLPQKSGSYTLSVVFDNRNLDLASHGYGNRLINQRIGTITRRPWSYVALTASCNVDISSRGAFKQMFENSESVTLCRFLGLDKFHDKTPSKIPVGSFRIVEFLKGPPFSAPLPVRLWNRSSSADGSNNKNLPSASIPEKGSIWIIVIPNAVPIDGCFETFNGTDGIIEATSDVIEQFHEIAKGSPSKR